MRLDPLIQITLRRTQRAKKTKGSGMCNDTEEVVDEEAVEDMCCANL